MESNDVTLEILVKSQLIYHSTILPGICHLPFSSDGFHLAYICLDFLVTFLKPTSFCPYLKFNLFGPLLLQMLSDSYRKSPFARLTNIGINNRRIKIARSVCEFFKVKRTRNEITFPNQTDIIVYIYKHVST